MGSHQAISHIRENSDNRKDWFCTLPHGGRNREHGGDDWPSINCDSRALAKQRKVQDSNLWILLRGPPDFKSGTLNRALTTFQKTGDLWSEIAGCGASLFVCNQFLIDRNGHSGLRNSRVYTPTDTIAQCRLVYLRSRTLKLSRLDSLPPGSTSIVWDSNPYFRGFRRSVLPLDERSRIQTRVNRMGLEPISRAGSPPCPTLDERLETDSDPNPERAFPPALGCFTFFGYSIVKDPSRTRKYRRPRLRVKWLHENFLP